MGYVDPTTAKLLFVDYETSGLDPVIHCPLSIGLIRTTINGVVIESFEAKIAPQKGAVFSEQALAINGYTEEKWEGAVRPSVVARKIIELSRGAVFSAHNAKFDWSFTLPLIGGELGWLGSRYRVDTADLAWPLVVEGLVPNAKLATLCAHFGIKNTAAHSALADAEACRRVYVELMALYRPRMLQPQAIAG